jgi:ubiquinone/menaquinone biosynthesis C-methylase UbiE
MLAGGGRFMDTLLERYPGATGTLLDNDQVLLDLNKPHPRKALVYGSAENLDTLFRGSQFDLVCFIYVLHHFVSDSYRATRESQVQILSEARELLSPRGHNFILEDIYTGLVFPRLPGRLIYSATSTK